MKVLIDTSVWSLMLRRNPVSLNADERELVRALHDIVNDGRAKIIGPIRQELLSGIKTEKQFAALKEKLSLFDDVELTTSDYENAASGANQCTRVGVATGSIDVLICAVALERQWQVFTCDKAFLQFKRILKFELYVSSIN